MKKIVLTFFTVLCLLSAVFLMGLALNIQIAEADYTWTETIYIRADGSIEPDTAPISTADNIIYTLTDNIVGDVPFDSKAIVVEKSNITIDGNGYTLQGSGATYSKGFYLSGIDNVTIKNTNIDDFGSGVELRACIFNSVSNNNITNNSHGISLSESSGNSISGNRITENCYRGIELWASSSNEIFGNKIVHDNYGIFLNCSTHNHICGNTITAEAESTDGITLIRSSNYNQIYGNNVTANLYGITLSWVSNNTVYGNNISNNGLAIGCVEASNNRFYHNNFINNTKPGYFYEYVNVWDNGYPSGGNYWSDYVGEDADGDRIGDTFYVLYADNQDRYPLMNPWAHELELNLKAPTHLKLGNSAIIEAKVDNQGVRKERDVAVFLLIDNLTVNSTIIPLLEAWESYTITHLWTPTIEGTYNITAYVSPVPAEMSVENNKKTIFVHAGAFWTVDDDGPADFHTIQDAIDAAGEGDTIFVHEGVYHEHAYPNYDVYIDKSISLIGENKSTTVIDGQGTDIVVYIHEDEVTISGFTIQNSGSGGFDLYRDSAIMIWSNGNSIFGNNIMNNKIGIYILDHGYNVVTGNDITDNYQGIKVWGFYEHPTNNTIYHNNLVNNTEQVRSDDATNAWDNGYPSGGNYWSDYTGADSDGDGIGDTSYEIDVDNQDKYPLMGIFSDFTATSEHHVQTVCNSTISDFHFNGTAICFDVTGESGTAGFCRTCIPTTLLNDAYRVFVNGTEILPPPEPLPCSNSTHSYLYFTYDHSTQDVVIIPEFPSMLIVPLLIALTLGVAVLLKRKGLCMNKTSQLT